MATTRADIRGWLERAKAEGATHMLVLCDTFDYVDYPVSVMPGQDPRKVVEDECTASNMQILMECYDLSLDWGSQLAERRSFHW